MNADFQCLPEAFRDRLHQIVPPDDLAAVIERFASPARPAFRVNTLIAEPESVVRQLQADTISTHSVAWLPTAFQVASEQRSALTHHALAENGALYLHNLSSMFAALTLAVQPGQTVLDLAAAPGGKTLQLAAMMEGQGMLSAVEPVRPRFFKLKENLKRAQAEFVKCYMIDGRQVAAKTGPRFDRVLLDAPCSSEARFQTHVPTSYDKWSLRKVAECRRKQKGLIKSAFLALQPGGEMVYSTCSFSPEENEIIVAGLLKKFNDQCELLPVEMPFSNWQPGLTHWEGKDYPETLKHCRRILPNDSFNGLFLAKIRKSN